MQGIPTHQARAPPDHFMQERPNLRRHASQSMAPDASRFIVGVPAHRPIDAVSRLGSHKSFFSLQHAFVSLMLCVNVCFSAGNRVTMPCGYIGRGACFCRRRATVTADSNLHPDLLPAWSPLCWLSLTGRYEHLIARGDQITRITVLEAVVPDFHTVAMAAGQGHETIECSTDPKIL